MQLRTEPILRADFWMNHYQEILDVIQQKLCYEFWAKVANDLYKMHIFPLKVIILVAGKNWFLMF